MSRYYSHLKTAGDILQLYNGRELFGNFLKDYFRVHKKHGSNDRKNITQLCYAYFRPGKALHHLPLEERILAGFFLCSNSPNELLKELKPAWNEMAGLPLAEKYTAVDNLTADQIFPWKEELGAGIDQFAFSASFFIQPDLFLRIRPGYEEIVTRKLAAAGISYKEINHSCLALPNTTKADTVLKLDMEAVIQDYSSQRVGELMTIVNNEQPIKVWDCCAASGGKSILAYDILKSIKLTVSDIRPAIIQNLHERFYRAGINSYTAFDMDLAGEVDHSSRQLAGNQFIIADVPCTGSGTWSRTPEQLFYFDPAAIERYSKLQKKIVHNVVPHLSKGGHLLYCTCSVFRKENEDVVELIRNKYKLQLIKKEYLAGYEQKADTLFAALFTA